jgi:hypothetical protein
VQTGWGDAVEGAVGRIEARRGFNMGPESETGSRSAIALAYRRTYDLAKRQLQHFLDGDWDPKNGPAALPARPWNMSSVGTSLVEAGNHPSQFFQPSQCLPL